MITLVGKENCGRCTMVKNILEEKNIDFEYKYISELENESEIMEQAIAKKIMNMPLIIKDGEIVTLQEVI